MNVKRNLSSLVSIPQMESDQEGLLVGGFSMLSPTDATSSTAPSNTNCSCNSAQNDCAGNGNCDCNGCQTNKNCNCDCGTTPPPTPGGTPGGTPGMSPIGSASNGGFFWGL